MNAGLPVITYNTIDNTNVPESFDAREAFKECKDVINHIRDQGRCGSCWAVSATSTFNDRACIASKGKLTVEFSSQHTTSCCDDIECHSYGCDGGMPDYAWKWFVHGGGVVTGGDYGDLERHPGETCWPYETSNQRAQSPSFKENLRNYAARESLVKDGTPNCRKTCLDTQYKIPFKDDRHKAKNAFVVSGDQDIKRALLEGPLTTTFTVYEDFLMYKGGVYEHLSGEEIGGHAVKLIGWGKSVSGKSFWLSVNSWNTTWGEDGLFRIKQGECDFGDLTTGGAVMPPTEDLLDTNLEL